MAVVGRGGPAFTIGSKLDPQGSGFGGTEVPGPGQYDSTAAAAAAILPNAPAYSISGRGRDTEGEEAGVGPGAYDVSAPGPGGPAFTMGAKTQLAGEAAGAKVPGPGAYDAAAAARVTAAAAPAWTLGQRLTAGGGGGEGAEGGVGGGPAPGDYLLPPLPAGVAFTIGARADGGVGVAGGAATPGPGEYGNVNGVGALGAGGPAYTMGVRLGAGCGEGAAREGAGSPGPGDYYNEDGGGGGGGSSGPAYTIGVRLGERSEVVKEGCCSPGPGAYDVRGDDAVGNGPAFTMGARVVQGGGVEGAGEVPGPGAYEQSGEMEEVLVGHVGADETTSKMLLAATLACS